jgi:hypothetical protein
LRVRVLDVIEVAVVADDSPFVDRACHGPNPPGVWTLLLFADRGPSCVGHYDMTD